MSSSVVSTASSNGTTTTTTNVREVKQKALTLLTDLYRTETGDVKRMAMSLLQTLYTLEDQEQFAEIEVKIEKLLKMINDQKNEDALGTAEGEEVPSDDNEDAPSLTDEIAEEEDEDEEKEGEDEEQNSTSSIVSVSDVGNASSSSVASEMKHFSERDRSDSSHSQEVYVKEAMLLQKSGSKRWKWPSIDRSDNANGKEINLRAGVGGNEDTDLPNESRAQAIQASKERFLQRWRESTSKLESRMETIDLKASTEQIVDKWRELRNFTRNNLVVNKNAKQAAAAVSNNKVVSDEDNNDDDASSQVSASTEMSSNPPSPAGSDISGRRLSEHQDSSDKGGKDDDLLHVIRNFVKEGDSNARANLENVLSTKRQNARNRWAEARAKWKWPSNNNTTTTTTSIATTTVGAS